MTIRINETSEVKELSITDINGIDFTNDLIGNSGAIGDTIIWDDENECYTTDEDTFDWWDDYANKLKSDTEELEELKELYDNDKISDIINDEFFGINDYNDHHRTYQTAFERIRNELAME